MEDDEPRAPRKRLEPLRLDPLGVTELQAYIGELRVEIERAEAEIARKRQHRGAAEAVFGRPRSGAGPEG